MRWPSPDCGLAVGFGCLQNNTGGGCCPGGASGVRVRACLKRKMIKGRKGINTIRS